MKRNKMTKCAKITKNTKINADANVDHNDTKIDKIHKYYKNRKTINPRKDRGTTQRIYLLKIYTTSELIAVGLQKTKKHVSSNSYSSSTSSADYSSTDTNSHSSASNIELFDPTFIRKFDLCGTTGNVYTVTISSKPICSCPDNVVRNNRCKHIFFILMRIMMVGDGDEDIIKYDNADLERMFRNMPNQIDVDQKAKADSHMIMKYSNISARSNKEHSASIKKINDSSQCPVCLDLLKDSKESISQCRYKCGSIIHDECAIVYNEHRNKTGYPSICFICHEKWTPVSMSSLNSSGKIDDVPLCYNNLG